MNRNNFLMIYGNDGRLVNNIGASNSFTGESWAGQFNKWLTYGTDPNKYVEMTIEELAEYQVALYLTSPFAKASINKPLTHIIGSGVYHKSHVNAKMLGISKESAKDLSKEIEHILHYEKLNLNYYEKQEILCREAMLTGDSILYFVHEDNPDGRPFDLVVAGGNEINNVTQSLLDHTIINGVIVDKFYRKKGIVRSYDNSIMFYVDPETNQRNFIQMMFQERASQVRGMPVNAVITSLLKNIEKVWGATTARMVQEAILLGYFATDSDVMKQTQNLSARARGKSKTEATNELSEKRSVDSLNPGSMYIFDNNGSMKFNDLKTPSSNFGNANIWTLNLVALATGYSPEYILSKYETSYSGHKGALNDVWTKVLKQRNTFVRITDNVVNWELIKAKVDDGTIKLPNKIKNDYKTNYYYKNALLAGTTLGEIPKHINPLQEVTAQIKAEEAGYNLKADNALKHGNVWDDVKEEWFEEQNEFNQRKPQEQAEIIKEADQEEKK